MKNGTWVVILVAALAAAGTAAAADPLYVQSARAALLQEPSLGGGTVADLDRGDALEVLERRDGWYRVRHDGREGWVSRLVVDTEPPMDRGLLLGGDTDVDADHVRRRPSQIASAAAARGLAEEHRAHARREEMARYDLLALVEELAVEEDEVHGFHAELIAGDASDAR